MMNETDSTMKSSEHFRKLRKRNMICFSFLYFAYGLEQIITISTLWAYLQTLVHPKHARTWYGAITCSYYIMEILTGLFLSGYVDETKNIRKVILCCLPFYIVGNIIYMVPFSAACLLIGRIISGIGSGWTPCVIGETNRIYPKNERSTKISTLATCWHISRVIGPGINIFFTSVDLKISSFELTYANIPGMYMAVLFIIVEMMSFFMITNLPPLEETGSECNVDVNHKASAPKTQSSNDFGLEVIHRDETSKRDNNLNDSVPYVRSPQKLNFESPVMTPENERDNEKTTLLSQSSPMTKLDFFLKILSCIDPMLIMFTAFLFTFRLFAVYMWVPILIIDDLKWSINIVYAIHLSTGAVFIATMVPFMIHKVQQRVLFKIYLSLYPLIIMYLLALLAVYLFPMKTTLNACLLSFYVLSSGITDTAEVLLITMLSLFLPNSALSKGESLRMALSRVGTILGTMLGGITYSFIPVVIPVMIVFALVIFVLFCWRSQSFISPKAVF